MPNYAETHPPTCLTVKIPKRLPPSFDGCCLRCGQDTPHRIGYIYNATTPWFAFLTPIWMLFGVKRLRLPVCPDCRWKFRFQRYFRDVGIWVVCILLCSVLYPWFADWNRLGRKFAVAAAVVVAMLPVLVLEMLFPRTFDTSSGPTFTSYDFADNITGFRFAAANRNKYPHTDIRVDVS